MGEGSGTRLLGLARAGIDVAFLLTVMSYKIQDMPILDFTAGVGGEVYLVILY